jgi:hypothetical protein
MRLAMYTKEKLYRDAMAFFGRLNGIGSESFAPIESERRKIKKVWRSEWESKRWGKARLI